MAQSVVYADLKFAMSPPLTAPTCPTALDEDDSPYENMPLGPVPVAPSPGESPAGASATGTLLSQGGHQGPGSRRWCPRGTMRRSPWCSSLAGRWPRRWLIPGGVLAASLLLLLLVATVALGVCYWQVTRRLQDTSREHAAEQGRLSQEVSERQRSLEQTRLELAWARAELQRAWREGNSSQLELGSRDAALGRARQELAALQQQVRDVQGELRASQDTVSSLRACVNTECCPSGWVLYKSKCLFISVEKRTWEDSRDDCRRKGAQLLVKGDWDTWTVPVWSRGLWHPRRAG
ncbi:CD72 protein, partial [Atlantisia rogersi]|nr:CD72 protein [Atlantisia rogersi]